MEQRDIMAEEFAAEGVGAERHYGRTTLLQRALERRALEQRSIGAEERC